MNLLALGVGIPP